MSHMIIFAEGDFGRAVAGALARRTPAHEHSLVAARGRFDDLVRGAHFVAVALWRRYDSVVEELGQACARAAIPWSLAMQSDQHLLCGPLVVPPRGACFRCFSRRYLAHHPGADRELALARAYDKDPALGVAGFLPPVVSLAAAALRDDARALEAAAGRVRRIDVLTGEVVDTRVVRVHGCELCGDGAPSDQSQRFVHFLVPAIRELLP